LKLKEKKCLPSCGKGKGSKENPNRQQGRKKIKKRKNDNFDYVKRRGEEKRGMSIDWGTGITSKISPQTALMTKVLRGRPRKNRRNTGKLSTKSSTKRGVELTQEGG